MIGQISLCCLLFIVSIQSLAYKVSVSNPFLLKNDNMGIQLIRTDNYDNFWVFFTDGSARNYSSNFLTYTNHTFPDLIQQFQHFSLAKTNMMLGNGTNYNMSSENLVTVSNNGTRLRTYGYLSLTPWELYEVGEKIFHFYGLPVQYLQNINPCHILICQKSIKIAYNQTLTTLIVFDSTFGTGVYLLSNALYQHIINALTGAFHITYIYLIALSNRNVIKVNVTFDLAMNFTVNYYQIQFPQISYAIVGQTSQLINTLLFNNNILIMQNNATGSFCVYDALSQRFGTVDSAIPIDQSFSFFINNNNYYILQSRGLIQVSFNIFTSKLTFIATSSPLPYNYYSLVFSYSGKFDVFYIPFGPNIYKSRYCLGQSMINFGGNLCNAYSCTALNCSECTIVAGTCGICNLGYTRNANYTCSLNITNTSNSTNNSITNITFANTTADNSTVPNQNFSQKLDQLTFNNVLDLLVLDIRWLQDFINYLILLLKQLISIPAARQTLPFFYYFGNFDDLYFYQFHNRTYGNTMSSLFEQLSSIQEKKWSIINYETVLSLLGIDASNYNNIVDYQREYVASPRQTNDGELKRSEGLLINSSNFFIVAVPITLLNFFIFKRCFYMLFKYPISRFLRKFDFWTYFSLLLFDGNVQQFSFYLGAEFSIFYFLFFHKVLKIGIMIFGFCLFIVSTIFFTLSFIFNKKTNRLLMDNIKNRIPGHFTLVIQFGFRNFLFGLLHCFLRQLEYTKMISVLLFFEAFFCFSFIFAMVKHYYVCQLKVWIYLLLTLTRIFLISTLLIDYSITGELLIEVAQLIIVIIMITIFCCGVLVELASTFNQMKDLVRKIFIISSDSSEKQNKTTVQFERFECFQNNNLPIEQMQEKAEQIPQNSIIRNKISQNSAYLIYSSTHNKIAIKNSHNLNKCLHVKVQSYKIIIRQSLS